MKSGAEVRRDLRGATPWVARAAAGIAATAAALVAATATAQPVDAAAATELFRQGRAALEAGDYAAACPKLEESQRMAPHVGTAISLATCEEAVRRLAAARAHWQQAADLARGLGDPRGAFAEARMAAIDVRVPRLTIRLPEGAEGAVVTRDGVELGPASLGVPLPVEVGPHAIVVSAPDREPATLATEVAEGDRKEVVLTLGPRRPAPVAPPAAPGTDAARPTSAPPRAHLVLEAGADLVVVRLTGGQVGQSCKSPCASGLPFYAVPGVVVVAGGAWELPSGLGFGARAGFLGLTSIYDNRSATVTTPAGADPGTVRDDVPVSGALAGATVSYHRGEAWLLTGRLGLGVYVSSTRDTRSGTFTTPAPASQQYNVNVSETHGATYLYVAPEVRLGRRVTDRLEISAGLEVLWLGSASPPTWADQTPVAAAPGGQGTFGKQTLTGSGMVVIAPGAAARYDF